MNRKVYLLLWVIQCALGFLISLSFVVLTVSGYDVKPYITTFVIAIIFLVMGIVGIVKWLKGK